MRALGRVGAEPLVVTVAWSIHSPGRQRKSLNWSVQSIGLLPTLPERSSRCEWDFTSGGMSAIDSGLTPDGPSSVNGCSMKTEANLAAVKAIPPGKIMFETGRFIPDSGTGWRFNPSPMVDAPWCSMTASHASRPHVDALPQSLRSLYFPPDTKPERFVYGKAVKGRNEPCAVGGVAWVLNRMNEGVGFERIAERTWKNTVEVFGLDELRDVGESVPTSVST